MIEYDFEEYCCGCRACENFCPVQAIEMVPDKSGLLYPKIDEEKCVGCGKCDKICPHLNAHFYKKEDTSEIAAWLYASSDNEAKKRSASGGAFYELAKKIVADGGYVCGCVWNNEMMAEHIVTSSEFELCRMQGSKYVQSDMKDCYQQILDLLKAKKTVLFSGTPCQVTAMHNAVQCEYSYLRKYLLTVGVICHGIAAPDVWLSYKKWLEKKQGSRLVSVNFRNKSQEGYKKSYCRYEFESGKITYVPTYLPSSKYIEATLVYNLALRKSCGYCDCKGVTEACDIILGDWYAEYQNEGALGTSCIAAFTEQGQQVVMKCLKDLRVFQFSNIVRDDGFIMNSVILNSRRDEFLGNLNDDIWDTVEGYYPPKYKIKKLLVQWGIYSWLKNLKQQLTLK